MQLWLTALRDSGYAFPLLQNKGVNSTVQPFSRITLLGQFNWDTPQSQAVEWVRMWSHVFPVSNIMLAMPQNRRAFHYNSVAVEAVPQVLRYFSDKGFYSPMLNLVYAIEESSAMRGVLYVHDDMLLSSALLARIGTEEWVATFDPVSHFQLQRDGSFRGTTPTSWFWWKKSCVSPLRAIATDPQMQPFWGQDTGLDLAVGQSDMLYVNTRNQTLMLAFTKLLRIFAQHELFLECALPSAVAIMRQKYHVRVHGAKLCTAWDKIRATPERWSCMHDKNYDAFHPIKSSAHHWTQTFRDITMG